MKYSVIIPNYNREKYLKKAIDSALCQVTEGLEVIIVDDGSTDNSIEILKSYSNDDRVKCIFQENCGIPAKVRNIGIEKSNGEWICLLDSDDFWFPGKINAIEKVIKTKNDPYIIGIGHYETKFYGEREGEVTRFRELSNENQYKDLLFNGNCLSTSTLCIRKEAIEQVGGFSEKKEYFAVEDYDLWMRLAQIGSFYTIKESFSGYRLDENNISGDPEILNRNLKKLVFDHIDLLDKTEVEKNTLKKNHGARIDYYKGRSYLLAGDFKKARSVLYNSCLERPMSLKSWVSFAFSMIGIKA